jgi:hypothetical protein
MDKEQVENKYGHGGRLDGTLRYYYRKASTSKLGRSSVPFDWEKGVDLEEKVMLTRRDQGNSSSCGGQAGAYFIEHQTKSNISAKSIYSLIHHPLGGATVSALETHICTRGANLELDVPSYENGNTPSERFMTDKSWFSPWFEKDAYKRAGYIPIRVAHNMEAMAEAIRDLGGIICMVAGQNNNTWRKAFPEMPTKKNKNPIWYHFLYFKGAKMINGKKYLMATNSWGNDTGENGVQYFDEQYMTGKYLIHASSFMWYERITPLESNKSIWAEILRYFHRTFKFVT